MPAMRFLETRKTHIRNAQLFGGKEAFEGLSEPVCQHLHGGGWDMFTATSLEPCRQIVLGGKRPILFILLLHLSQHLIIELAGLSQATHEQTGLVLIRIQSKLKRSHALTIAIRERNVNSFVPPVGGRQFIPMSEDRDPLAAGR